MYIYIYIYIIIRIALGGILPCTRPKRAAVTLSLSHTLLLAAHCSERPAILAAACGYAASGDDGGGDRVADLALEGAALAPLPLPYLAVALANGSSMFATGLA